MFIFCLIEIKKVIPTARIAALSLAALALGAAAAACAPPPTDGGEGETMRFIGHVSDVRARSLTELEALRVTDAAGASRWFRAEEGRAFDEFTPSHAREHMLTGEPIEVTYRESSDGTLFIVDLADAAPPATPAPF